MLKKRCSICEQSLPANTEYFHKHTTGKYNLRGHCIKCDKKKKEKYRKENSEKIKEYNKTYKPIVDKEILRQRGRQHYENNRLEMLEKNKRYRQENKDRIRIHQQTRRSKGKSVPSDFNVMQWETCKQYFDNKCAYCGTEEKLTMDHFLPISKYGEFSQDNIIPSCKHCNCRKSNKNFFEWYPAYKHYNKHREQKILSYLNYKGHMQQLSIL